MFTSLKGRSVVVTGASKGIGRGLAQRFGLAGCKVLVVSRNLGEAKSAAADILAAGGTALAFEADVTRQADMQAMARTAAESFGGIDILCANAGIFPASPLATMSEADFDAVMATNLKGTFLAVSACLPAMKEQKKGRIILTSSITGAGDRELRLGALRRQQGGAAGVHADRGHRTRSARYYRERRIAGNIFTEGLRDLGQDYIHSMEASVPMGRLGSVTDVANAALFFATDEAAYITGQSLVIDGGQILPESLAAMAV